MRSAIRSLAVVAFVIAGVLTLGWSAPLTALVQLVGTTALIMGGTQHPLINPSDRLLDFEGHHSYGFSEGGLAGDDGLPAGYVGDALSTYIRTAGSVDEQYNVMAVWTPEAFWPVFGAQTFNNSVQTGLGNLDVCLRGDPCTAHVYPGGEGGVTDVYSVFAYSQSARIASLEKAGLIKEYRPDGPIHLATFVMIGNPNRPNGGVLQRFKGLYIPILDVSFDGSSPTNSPTVDGQYLFPTADIARQFDGWTDFPLYPINLLADVNALFGIAFLHGDYFRGTSSNPVAGQRYLHQGQVGDTNYYMIGTPRLPILLPLAAIGVPDPILAALDAPLRVLIEWGYNRDISPGVPTGARLFPGSNIVTDLSNLVVATFTGLDDGISIAVGDPTVRPFRTQPVESTFGVGGVVLPTTTHPVAATTPSAQPLALEAPLAPTVDRKVAAREAKVPAVAAAPDPAPATAVPVDGLDPVAPVEVSAGGTAPDPGVDSGVSDPVDIDRNVARKSTHLDVRHQRQAAEGTNGPAAPAPRGGAPKHRMAHGKDRAGVGAHAD